MNVYDSVKMADMMEAYGYEQIEDYQTADMVILNTCHIREKAAEKMYSDLGRVRQAKQKNKKDDMVIAVAGCVAQAEGDEIFKRAPFVDVVVGPQSYYSLPDLVASVKRDQKKAINLDFAPEPKFDNLPEEKGSQGPAAFLSVQEGCDKFCTFCVVPYTRGAEFSRSVEEIYREAQELVAKGAREINLLGQNVNAYHGATHEGEVWSLAKLINHLAHIKGLDRIRYTTSHPREMTDDLLDIHANEPKLMPYLHLPIQAGSDRVLKAMNRKHTGDFYRRIIDKLREKNPDIALSSDFIVGFPGETDQDFEDTMKLVEDIQYASAYSFKYSPRPGTPAAESDDQVPEEVKVERLARLQDLLSSQQKSFNLQTVGKVVPVLFDQLGKRDGQVTGRSPYMQQVYVEGGPELVGTIQDVTVTSGTQSSIAGKVNE